MAEKRAAAADPVLSTEILIKKVKVKVKVKLTLEQAMKTQRVYSTVPVQLYCVFNLGARLGWVVNPKPRQPYPWERDPVSIVQKGGWATGPVCTGSENLTPTGIRSRTV
jgi:hypothetical protein